MWCADSGAIPAFNPNTNDSLQLYIGVIDILQSYRFAKKFEHTFKSIVHDAVRSACSLFASLVVTVLSFVCRFLLLSHFILSLMVLLLLVFCCLAGHWLPSLRHITIMVMILIKCCIYVAVILTWAIGLVHLMNTDQNWAVTIECMNQTHKCIWLVFGMSITTEDSCYVVDGVHISHGMKLPKKWILYKSHHVTANDSHKTGCTKNRDSHKKIKREIRQKYR